MESEDDYDSLDSESDTAVVSDEGDEDRRVLDEQWVRGAVRKWISRSMQFRILVAGKIGSGKSSLINTLLRKELTREGGELTSETSEVSPCSGVVSLSKDAIMFERVGRNARFAHITTMIDNIQVTLWDTPGLSDPSTDTEQTLREITEKCRGKVDLFVYCVQMTQNRLGNDEIDSILNLTTAMGKDVWKYAIFALTFANEVRVPPNCHESPDVYYGTKVMEWKHNLRCVIKLAGVPREDIISVPVVPCGYRDSPLPCTQKWASFFWVTCMKKVRPEYLPAFMIITQSTLISDPKAIRCLFPLKPFSRRLKAALKKFCLELRQEYPANVGLPQYNAVLSIDTQRLLEYLLEEITAIKRGTWKRDPLTVFIVLFGVTVILGSFLYKNF